jgi:flagellar protein FlbD
MIHLTRLNNQPLVVNADLIKFIENAPDTVITLLTGEKIVVRESAEEVLERISEFHKRFYRRVAPGTAFDASPPEPAPGNEPGSETGRRQTPKSRDDKKSERERHGG